MSHFFSKISKINLFGPIINRFLIACLGFLILIFLFYYKNISSIPNNIKSSIHDAGKTISHALDEIQVVGDIIIPMSKKAIDLWNRHYPPLWDGNIMDKINSLYSPLNFEQHWARSHIFACILMLILIISIISIIYSDFLLNYFKIEEKFPRLGRIIKYRRLFQQYYLIINLLLIILTLLATIFINYAILTS